MEKKNLFVKNLVDRMNLDQKVGALFTLSFTGRVPKSNVYKYITELHAGGLRLSPQTRLFGSYVDPRSSDTIVKLDGDGGIKHKGTPISTASEYKAILQDLQKLAQNRPLSLPLHFSFDQEGGTSADFSFSGVNIFTKPMGLVASGDKHLAYLTGKAIAEQTRSVGFNWIHSPVLDINTSPDNPEIQIRAYSDNVDVATEYARETAKGLRDGGVIATAKHFPGRGDSAVDAHYSIPVIDIDKQTMYDRELKPYQILIDEGLLPSIMIAHSIFPAFDEEYIATVSRKILTGLLREEMGFEGVITTDSMTMGSVATQYGVPEACAMSLEAGADLVLLKAENDMVEDTIELVKQYVRDGKITEAELDDKVYRVLNLKHEYGMFYGEYEISETPEEVFARPHLRQLAKQVAKRSVLVARGEESLPLNKEENVLFIEQKPLSFNDGRWHSGILTEAALHLGANVTYLETDYRFDERDEERVKNDIHQFDTVVITSYFNRAKLGNKAVLEEALADYKGKVIIVTNTPYQELSIPSNAENVIVSFSTGPDNAEVVAQTLYGETQPEGVWPIDYKLPEVEGKKKVEVTD